MQLPSLSINTLLYSSLDALQTSVWAVDRAGTIRYANPFALTISGYDGVEILSMKVWEMDVGIPSHEHFLLRFETLSSGRYETFFRQKNGHLFPVEVTYSVVDHGEGRYTTFFANDISARLERYEELDLFHRLIDESNDMVYFIRIEDGFIEYANRIAEEMTGYTLKEMNELGIHGFRRPLKADEHFLEHLQNLKAKGRLTDYAMVIRKDGSEFPVEASVRAVHYHGTDYNIAIVRDITDRAEYEAKLAHINDELETLVQVRTRELKQQIARLESYKKAMDANSIVSISDLRGQITYVNENFCRVSGYACGELIGKAHSIVRHPDTPSSVFTELWETIQAKKVWKGILRNRKKNGETYIIDVAILPILDEKGEIVEYIAIRHEITELFKQKEELRRQAYVDELTGFGSRNRLIEDIKTIDNPLLGYIDIDQFNTINDFYGMEFGDRLLTHFSRQLNRNFGDHVRYYRLHGDQFAILTEQSREESCTMKLTDFIVQFNRQSYIFEEKEITLRITASVSSEPKEMLLSSCDLAKRYAKKHHKPFVAYDAAMGLEEEIHANMNNAVKLQHALNEDRIAVFCQPIASATTLVTEKFECLMRLIDEDGTVLTPYQFLEAAKQSKQYSELSRTVILKAFALVERFPDKSFSINITIEDVLNEEIVSLIYSKLAQKISPMPVIFELVESEGIESFDQVTLFVKKIKSYGALLAIDDFGTGYSNFEYLLKLDADIIKIDGSLIRNIETNSNIQEIVKLIVEFAKRQNIQTVAEFVSSEGILESVRELGIEYVQGYHIGKPEPLN